MNLSLRRIFTLTLKSLLVLIGLLVLVIVGLIIYFELKSRPPGSPPPGYEGRLKYDWSTVPGSYSSRKVPVDLWFGRRDGIYDTTHLRIDSDYFGIVPHFHGEAVHINTIWPSMQSRHEYGRMRKEAGLPYERDKEFTIIIAETRSKFGTDKYTNRPTQNCGPIIHDELRGVKYCNVKKHQDKLNERWTYYWPLNETVKTPWYDNQPRFSCKIVERSEENNFNACGMNFSYNADIYVWMEFVPEQLAIEIISDFTRLTEFLSTLEVKP